MYTLWDDNNDNNEDESFPFDSSSELEFNHAPDTNPPSLSSSPKGNLVTRKLPLSTRIFIQTNIFHTQVDFQTSKPPEEQTPKTLVLQDYIS